MLSERKSLDYLCIIQARLGSTRLPGKCLMTVGGIPMVKRVWNAAKEALDGRNAKVIVAWPERYPDLDENWVWARFYNLAMEFPSKAIIRLTADCPLLTSDDIRRALNYFEHKRDCATFPNYMYYSNHLDGHDVQIFEENLLTRSGYTHPEHVIADFTTVPVGLSVNTKEDLQRVRDLCKVK